MRAAAMRVRDDGARRTMLEIADSPVLVPLTQADKYGRVYGFCRELGGGAGKHLTGEGPLDFLREAFQYGFASACDIETPQYEGAAGLCFECGKLAGGLVASLFPEDDEGDAPDFQPPDFEEITEGFLEGLALGLTAED